MAGKPPVRLPVTQAVDMRLLEIAATTLKARGLKAVTVVDVAREAGMTHANVYRYFPSKGALVDAIAARWLAALESTIADIADAPDPADDKLERVVQELSNRHRVLLHDNAHLFDVLCDATQASRALIRKHRTRLRHLVERVLDEGIATAKFDPRDRDRAFAFITDSTFRFINPIAVRMDAGMPDDIIEQRLSAVIRVLLRALANGTV